MGRRYVQACESQSIVALCDVDHSFAAPLFRRYPGARIYRDYREMFDKEEKNIDAVIVATPDHSHALVTMRALAMRKHVYCAKPLTHTIHEAGRVAEAARAAKVSTQMSVQSCASEGPAPPRSCSPPRSARSAKCTCRRIMRSIPPPGCDPKTSRQPPTASIGTSGSAPHPTGPTIRGSEGPEPILRTRARTRCCFTAAATQIKPAQPRPIAVFHGSRPHAPGSIRVPCCTVSSPDGLLNGSSTA